VDELWLRNLATSTFGISILFRKLYALEWIIYNRFFTDIFLRVWQVIFGQNKSTCSYHVLFDQFLNFFRSSSHYKFVSIPKVFIDWSGLEWHKHEKKKSCWNLLSFIFDQEINFYFKRIVKPLVNRMKTKLDLQQVYLRPFKKGLT